MDNVKFKKMLDEIDLNNIEHHTKDKAIRIGLLLTDDLSDRLPIKTVNILIEAAVDCGYRIGKRHEYLRNKNQKK